MGLGQVNSVVQPGDPIADLRRQIAELRSQIAQFQAANVTDGSVTTSKIAEGAVTSDSIASDAIDGRTITGGTIQTATDGQRMVLAPLDPSGRLDELDQGLFFYPDDSIPVTFPGYLTSTSALNADGTPLLAGVVLQAAIRAPGDGTPSLTLDNGVAPSDAGTTPHKTHAWLIADGGVVDLDSGAGVVRLIGATANVNAASVQIGVDTNSAVNVRGAFTVNGQPVSGGGLTLSAWAALTLPSGVTADSGFFTPGVQTLGTDRVFMRGLLRVANPINAFTTIASLPSTALTPQRNAVLNCRINSGTTTTGAAAAELYVNSNGTITCSANLAANSYVSLEGVTYGITA